MTSYLKEQLAGLAFCQVKTGQPPSLNQARAASWHNLILRMGVALPLYLLHDLGLLLCTPRAEVRLAGREPLPPLDPGTAHMLSRYQALLRTLQDSAPLASAAALPLRDELIAAVLLRTCGELARRLPEPATPLTLPVELPLLPGSYAGAAAILPGAAAERPLSWLKLLTTEPQPLHLQTAVELIDAETLRLLSLSAGGAELLRAGASGDSLDLFDLLAVLQAQEARDIVRFSLELLPAILEARTATGSQSYPTGGYAALHHRGGLDALLPSELASDEEVLYTRYALGDLLYYGREQQKESPPRLHYVLVDASPSMRGLRQVFARGLALSLCKRLSQLGGEVLLRFFDARLHDAITVRQAPARLLPHLLGFRSQRGRNYGRVFRDLLSELAARSLPDGGPRRPVTVYLLTHGECHIPPELVRALRRQATLYGVFMLPSGALQLSYLSLLHRHQVVQEEALLSATARRSRALSIVSDVTSLTHAGVDPAAKKPGGRAVRAR